MDAPQPAQRGKGPEGRQPTSAAASDLLDNLSVEAYIDLYFEAEEAGERDFVLAKICAHKDPQAMPFLLALLAHEDDIFLRLMAAEALMGRGVEEARQVLLGALHAAGDDEVFQEAMEALLRGAGATIFADLAAIYADDGRDFSERLAVMSGMERADPQQAQATFLAALARMPHEKSLDASELEAMLGCFVRVGSSDAKPALEALHNRLAVTSRASAAEDDEVRTVKAALAVLSQEAEPGA